MQLKSVKNAADLPFKGIELVKVDGRIDEVIIGGKLHIKGGQYGGMSVLVRTLGEEAKRVKITATHDVFGTVTEFMPDDYSATQRADELIRAGSDVKRESVSVLIDEAGEVVSETGGAVAQSLADDIPF